jgi:hypothetical protein
MCTLFLVYSQIWLNPPMDDHQPHWLATDKNSPKTLQLTWFHFACFGEQT